MSEPQPSYTVPEYDDVEIVPERSELMSAYRAAVSAALVLQRALGLPAEQQAVRNRQQRRDEGPELTTE